MKASELIVELVLMIAKHGDQAIIGYDYKDEPYLVAKPHVTYSDSVMIDENDELSERDLRKVYSVEGFII